MEIEIIVALAGVVVTLVVGLPQLIPWLRKKRLKKKISNENASKSKKWNTPKKIVVGCIPFPPFMNFEKNGHDYKYSGLFYEIFELIGELHEIKIVYKPIQNEESISALNEGKVDCVACLFKTFERAKNFDFASCFYTVSVGGVIRKNEERIKVQSDLVNPEIKVAVVKGEVGSEIVKETFKINKDTKRLMELETCNVGSVASLVETEMVDIAITDNITCKLYLDEHKGANKRLEHIFIDYPLYLGQVGLMISTKESDFREWLEDRMKSILKLPQIKQKENEITEEYKGIISSIFPKNIN